MKNAVYFFTTPIWDNIPELMEKHGILCKLKISAQPTSSQNFCIWQSLPHNLTDFSMIKKYTQINEIKINPDIQKDILKILPLYIDQISRLDTYYKACYHDYVNHFHIMFNFLYKALIAEEIDIIFMTSYPHHGIDLLLSEIASHLNIKIIYTLANIESETLKPILHWSDTTNPDEYYHLMVKKRRESNIKIPTKFEKNLPYMKNIKKIVPEKCLQKINYIHIFKFIFNTLRKKFNKQNSRHVIDIINKYYKIKDSLYFRDKYILHNINFNQKYVYFGLHLQPEYTTSFWGKEYIDQLLAIEHLSYILPQNWKIFVKENPKQAEFQRHRMFYERLNLIDKVIQVPNETNTYDLIKNSQFVASITGTMLYEAVSGGKPAVIFGRYWYENLPGVFRFNKNLNAEEIANYKIDHNKLNEVVSDFFSRAEECIQEIDFLSPDKRKENDEYFVKILLEAIN